MKNTENQKNHYVLKRKFAEMESKNPGSLYAYTLKGMQNGTLSIQELRQIGLVAKNILYDTYGFDIPTLTGYDDDLLRLVMASLLPTAQALACLQGIFWMVDRESLAHACEHAGQYHQQLYIIAEQQWGLRVYASTWTTQRVRDLRKTALKDYKSHPNAKTAWKVAVSLLPPAEAQIAYETDADLTPAQLRTAIHRAPSKTYERAVADYTYALEVSAQMQKPQL